MAKYSNKRSSSALLSRMQLRIAAAPVAASVLLSGCSDSRETAQIYSTLDDCISDNPQAVSQCETAYQSAVDEATKTAPRYASLSDCEYDFGANQCRQGGGSFFMPFMAGYMLSNLMSPSYYSRPLFTSYSRYSPNRYQWLGADGRSFGDHRYKQVKVRPSAFKQKPAVVRTIKRGGFGSTAKAKSSWGSSRRGGWGG